MEPEDVSQDFTDTGDLGYSQASQPFAFESQDDGPSQQVRHPRVLSTPPAHPPTAFAVQAYNFLEEEDVGAANESVTSSSEAAKPIEVEEAYPEVAVAGAAPLDFVEECVETDASAPTDLPYWACTYCNIHSPASVVKCASTGKWFCNSKAPGLPASCIIYHLVRSKHNEVVLHKESPLGEITLECFLTGTKNVFQLGPPPPRRAAPPPRPAASRPLHPTMPASPTPHAPPPTPPRTRLGSAQASSLSRRTWSCC